GAQAGWKLHELLQQRLDAVAMEIDDVAGNRHQVHRMLAQGVEDLDGLIESKQFPKVEIRQVRDAQAIERFRPVRYQKFAFDDAGGSGADMARQPAAGDAVGGL